MPENDKPVANPLVVLREEFDDWAILFDPESGNGFGLNPLGVFIWKRLEGRHTIQDILKEVRENCENVPKEAKEHIEEFIQNLVEHGFVEYEAQEVG